jgi:hypothetical protein
VAGRHVPGPSLHPGSLEHRATERRISGPDREASPALVKLDHLSGFPRSDFVEACPLSLSRGYGVELALRWHKRQRMGLLAVDQVGASGGVGHDKNLELYPILLGQAAGPGQDLLAQVRL